MSIYTTLTPDWLKERYLAGIPLQDTDGNPFPDSLYTHAITAAVQYIESELDLVLEDTQTFTYRHDADVRDIESFYLFNLPKRPVWSVSKFTLHFANISKTELPTSLLLPREPLSGQVQILPGPVGKGLNSTAYDVSFWFYTMSTGMDYLPGWFEVEYQAGYGSTEHPVPEDILNAIGITAALLPLVTAGDLVLGTPGVAVKNVTLDAMHTAMHSTASAMFSGFSARIEHLRKQLVFMLTTLKGKYRPPSMRVI